MRPISRETVVEYDRLGWRLQVRLDVIESEETVDLSHIEISIAERDTIRLVMLSMPEHQSNMYALEQITKGGYEGFIAALAQYPDQAERLQKAGAHVAFNAYAEAGTGFAAHIDDKIRELTSATSTQGD